MQFLINLLSFLIFVSLHVNYSFGATIDFPFSNYPNHKTNMFYNRRGSIDGYVFRRANNISFTINLDQPATSLKDLQLILDFESKFTVPVPSTTSRGFQLFRSVSGEKAILATLWIPETAEIGVWRFNIIVTTTIRQVYSTPKIYILFNPWSPLDDVYLPDNRKLEEYIGNEVGFVYGGSWSDVDTRVWLYDQFKFSTLRSIMFILERHAPSPLFRNDPVKLTRAMSAALNAQDDEGVIEGKWTEPFPPNHPKPWDWLGSNPILVQYYLTNGTPVKFGQCWVFAAVFTTVLRALGIPSRPVSNFLSAHLRERDFVLDRIANDKNNSGKDDYWNFHVWTEAWMKRRDLSPMDVGWQATDATPQEISDSGYWQLGPASVNFIRAAKLLPPHDAAFIYEEVNADMQDWKMDEKGEYKKIAEPVIDFVGKFILTKNAFPAYMAGKVKQYEDLTLTYKPPERTPAERLSFQEACKQYNVLPYLKPTRVVKRQVREDPVIMNVNIQKTMIGQPLHINIIIVNKWFFKRTVDLTFKACSNYYNGTQKASIRDKSLRLKLNVNEERHIRMTLQPADYLSKLEQYALLKIQTSAEVLGSNAFTQAVYDYAFTKPKLVLFYNQQMFVESDNILKIQVQNPLPFELTYCHVVIQGLCSNQKIIYIRNVGIGETYVLRELLYFEYDCIETLVASLSCNELNDIRGYAFISVLGRGAQPKSNQVSPIVTQPYNQAVYKQYQQSQQVSYAVPQAQQFQRAINQQSYYQPVAQPVQQLVQETYYHNGQPIHRTVQKQTYYRPQNLQPYYG